MNAGRELDALIAEKVMGLQVDALGYVVTQRGKVEGELPFYSTDIAAAWEVVERTGLQIEIQSPGAPCNGDEYENDSDNWRVECRLKSSDRSSFAEATTAPLAICLAALKAVGIHV